MTCTDRDREMLSALLDGELSDKETAEMTTRMKSEPALRQAYDELRETRDATRVAFADLIQSAPPAPDALSAEPRPIAPPRRARLITMLTALAAAAAIIIAIVLNRSDETAPLPIDPEQFLQHAASQFMELQDAELYVTFTAEGVSILKTLFDEKEKKEDHRARRVLRVLMKSPDYFLAHPVANTRSVAVTAGSITGFDGRRAWSYDDKKNVITLDDAAFRIAVKNEHTDTKLTLHESPDNIFKLVTSWKALSALARGKGADIEETTGPADERAGRRVFTFSPDAKSDDNKWAFQNYRVTIDAENARIERLEYDFRVIGFSMIKADIQLSRTDLGLNASDFQMARYTPRDATIVVKPKDKKKSQKKSQKKSKKAAEKKPKADKPARN